MEANVVDLPPVAGISARPRMELLVAQRKALNFETIVCLGGRKQCDVGEELVIQCIGQIVVFRDATYPMFSIPRRKCNSRKLLLRGNFSGNNEMPRSPVSEA